MTLASDLLQLAQLAQAVYIDDPSARAISVRFAGAIEIVKPYETPDHRAIICDVGGELPVLVICGTRFKDMNAEELFDDVDESAIDLTDGQRIVAGANRGTEALYLWANAAIKTKFGVAGHSLGGARAHLAPIFVDPRRISQITTYGAPKVGNQAFWDARFKEAVPLRRVVNERDMWAGWPFFGEWRNHNRMIWRNSSLLKPITEAKWPGARSFTDHSIDTGYVAGIEAIAAMEGA